jgi:hypothetical protein
MSKYKKGILISKILIKLKVVTHIDLRSYGLIFVSWVDLP